jgi:hypothetical protein
MNAVKPPCRRTLLRGPRTHTKRCKLREFDHTVLLACERSNLRVEGRLVEKASWWDVFSTNPTLEGHAEMLTKTV